MWGGQVPCYVPEVVETKTGSMLSSFEIFRQRKSDLEMPIMTARVNGQVQSHFLDSGAFTLQTKAVEWAKENGRSKWDFYDTPEHWQYLDDYADFVKKYQVAIDLYANVDAIPNPKITYRNQKYLEEKHGLSPVPVVHFGTDLKWLRRYVREGYELIGLGGLVGKTGDEGCRRWIDQAFEMISDPESRLPQVKLHGFGVTAYPLLIRYPWWSVDSVTWAKVGGFGSILVPHKRRGEFTFGETPYVLSTSIESGKRKESGSHYLTLTPAQRNVVDEWLKLIGIPLGKVDENGEVLENGVLTRHTERRAANLHFFERLRKWLPEWPWPWKQDRRKGFGLR